MKTLALRVKKLYFDQMKSGEKKEEYRLVTPYWTARIEGKTFDGLVIIWGWVANSELCEDNCISFPWNGYEKRIIQHDEFGSAPVEVYAIKLQE